MKLELIAKPTANSGAIKSLMEYTFKLDGIQVGFSGMEYSEAVQVERAIRDLIKLTSPDATLNYEVTQK